MPKIERSAIYIRVSTAEQMMHGKSLQAQKDSLVQYARDHDMVVTGVYADEGKTARKELKRRAAIHQLLEDVRKNKIDVILFWRLDRWFRNISDFYKVQEVLEEYNVRWISISEPGINMESRDGRLQLNVVLSIGQNEVDTTSERIKFVNESSIRQGKLIFGDANMPLGYRAGVVDGKKCMMIDPDTEEMTKDFFQYFKQHGSKTKAIRYMQDTYGIDFSYSMLRTMLSSEFYKGTYRGFPYCPSYLTENEWNEIQMLSKRNAKATPSGRIYHFSSLMHCPYCGQKLVGTGCSSIINRKTGAKRTYCYYRCNRALMDNICTYRHRVSQNLIEQYLLDNLESEYRKYIIRNEKVHEEKKKKNNQRTPKKIEGEIERLNMMFQKGRIEWDYYNEQYNSLDMEMHEVLNPVPTVYRDLTYLDDLFENDFKSMYSRLSMENKRAFWRSCIKEIHLKKDSTVDYVDFF